MEIERRLRREETIHVRVDAELLQRAVVAASAAGVTLSDLVRAGMREAIRSVLGQFAAEGTEREAD